MFAGLAGPDADRKKSLRLAAWTWVAKGRAGETFNPFDCDRYCGTAGENTQERIARGCTRADLPPVPWDVDADRIAFHLGAAGRGAEPVEHGCPGGYQRAWFVWSLDRYMRRRTAQGDRVSNPHLDRSTDFLVVDAVLYMEREEERCRADNAAQWAESSGDA